MIMDNQLKNLLEDILKQLVNVNDKLDEMENSLHGDLVDIHDEIGEIKTSIDELKES
jgi:predicted  nucleic acid-binding Zn-ribbon protein